ncbi:hypothetical protein QBC41DRAFT_221688 [Cercophora samala]|uniref:Uncharacterized protein n=1 Tax=Cercophora samala TaxID=330535 RepID=A0AA39ZG99_9PEZI|nr:hypothetical protein QBC41DRAFT_221688 [Cercophora samala]
MSSDRRPPASGSYHPVVQPVCIYKQQPPDFRRFQPPVVEDDEEYWTNLFTKGSHPPREPPPNPAFDQPPLPPPNPPPPQPTPSPLQTYLTSRLKSQSTKPHVITIGEYDKLMSNHPAYTPPVGYLADYAILTASASPNPIQKENHKDRKKREEMMRREESASFGFAQRLWKRHCEAVRVRNPTDEYGGVEGDGGDEMQEGEEVKMELDEEIYLRAQQISRRKRGKEEDVGGRSKKVKGKGREKEREVVVEVPRIARRDKGKGRERGQDYFTETVQGGQTWSFGGLDGGMDVDEGGAEGGGDGRSCYQATVEDGEEEL